MMRPHLTLVVNNHVSCARDSADVDQTSWSNEFDPYWLKSNASDLWSGYFKSRFRSPREVALFCDVSFQTALNWWGAATAPTSHIALLVMLTDPDAPAFFAGSMSRAA